MRFGLSTFLLFFIFSTLLAQQNPLLQVEAYKLDNGLTVLLNQDSTAVDVFGVIAVNAGSKNDPAHATGIAHYLEHLLFKGTEELGTWDYKAEKIHLDEIRVLYQQLGQTTDEAERANIQQQISQASAKAGKYALANEMDNLLKSIGATGVNATTSEDMTIYYNSFPSHQMSKWLDLYAHRFQKPVFRTFQTELEIVYEEKNRAMDDWKNHVEEHVKSALFAPHPYGTQSIFGTTEHLKNPNLEEMYRFFKKYYVPNNMALILTGNFDKARIKPLIAQTLGALQHQPTPPQSDVFPNNKNIKGEVVSKIKYTPNKQQILGFKTVGRNHPMRPRIDIIQQLLSNQQRIGLLDQLSVKNAIQTGQLTDYTMNDDGACVINIQAKSFQSFKKTKQLCLQEIEKIHKGAFDDALLKGIQHELAIGFQKSLEELPERGKAIALTWSIGIPWKNYVNYPSIIQNTTKQEIQETARQYFGNNFIHVQSCKGIPPKDKLPKPKFEPVQPDVKQQSDYAKQFYARPSPEVAPRFLDFKNDVTLIDLPYNNKLYCTKNPLNDIFTISIDYQYGNDNNADIRLATQLMPYTQLPEKSRVATQTQLANLGASFTVQAKRNFLHLEIQGLEQNLAQTLQIINTLVHYPIIEEQAIHDLIKQRAIANQSHTTNIKDAVQAYAIYGKNTPFLRKRSAENLRQTNIPRVIQAFQRGMDYGADIHYVGTKSAQAFEKIFMANFTLSNKGVREPLLFMQAPQNRPAQVNIIHDDNVRQSQIYFYIAGNQYSKNEYLDLMAFNTYIGDNFSGLLMEEIRAYRSLAYSTWGYSYLSSLKGGKPTFFNSYIGCQVDKTNEAIDVMMRILKQLPAHPERMPRIQKALQQQSQSHYPSFRMRSKTIAHYKKEGYRKSPPESFYAQIPQLTFDNIKTYYKKHIIKRPIIITILTNSNHINTTSLQQYGKLKLLKKEDIISK